MATMPLDEQEPETMFGTHNEAEEALSHEELASLLAEDERLAVSFRDSTLAEEQAVAIDYYEARAFGDEEEGLSQVVMPEVAEVCDYMTISVQRTIMSSGNVVEFESAEADADAAATEATAAVSYCFMKEQDGYRVVHDLIQCGLIEKIGVVKTSAETHRKTVKSQGVVTEEQLTLLHQSLGETEKITGVDDRGDGTFLIAITATQEETKFVDYTVPSEEFLFASRTRHEDDAEYLCHRSAKTESDLIEMGFDRELIEGLPNDEGLLQLDSRAVARWRDETNVASPGLKKVYLREEYKRVDIDGDGIAELVQVFRVGETILSVEEVDEAPFVVWCPFPRAHRLVGNSLADKVMDLQRVKSVMVRQILDAVYMGNNPRMFLPDDCITDNTIDDLLTVRPGGIVRGKGTGPKPLVDAFDMSKGMTMLQFLTGERESRTGITRLNQGLDADAINQTATGTALLQAQGQQMEEYVSRNFAEGLARLFAKKLRLMQKVGKAFPIKVDGVAKMVDPSKWPEGLSATARVGLGSGRKDQRLQFRAAILEAQKEAAPDGLSNAKKIYNNLAGGVRDMGMNPNDFFVDPDSPEGQQAQTAKPAPPPSADILKAQAEAAAHGQRLQLDQQKAQSDAQIQAATAAGKLQQMNQAHELSIQLARAKAQAELEIARERQAAEFELRSQAIMREHELRQSLNMPAMRPGGALDQ